MNDRIIAALAVIVFGLAPAAVALSQDVISDAQVSKGGSVIILPIAFYSPETKLAGGLGGLLTFRRQGAGAAERPSSFYFYAIYTQMKQFSMSWEPEFYFRKESWLAKGRLVVERYPDKFWGTGPDCPRFGRRGLYAAIRPLRGFAPPEGAPLGESLCRPPVPL